MLANRLKIIVVTGLVGLTALISGTAGAAVSGLTAMSPGQHQDAVPNPYEGAVVAAGLSDYPDAQAVPQPWDA